MSSKVLWKINLLSVVSVSLIIFAFPFGIGIPDRIPGILFFSAVILFLLPVFLLMQGWLRSASPSRLFNKKRLFFISVFCAVIFLGGYYALYQSQVKCLDSECVYYPFFIREDTAERIRLAGGKAYALHDGLDFVKEDLEETTKPSSWFFTSLAFWTTFFFGATSSFVAFYLGYAGVFPSGILDGNAKIRVSRDEIQNLVGNNHLMEAFDLLLEGVDRAEIRDDVLLIKAAFQENKLKFNTGEISSEAYNESLAKTRRALLDFV